MRDALGDHDSVDAVRRATRELVAVQRLAHDALDTVRRQQWRAAEPDDKDAIKGTRFALQKNPWNLTQGEHEKLTIVQRSNKPL